MLKEGIFLGKRYEILDRIGSGGMADVYKGKDHKLNRYVAVKVLKSDYRTDEVFIQKFLSEAQAAAGLMHPNVVNVYDVGQDRGLYFMVMELVEGITLKDYIEKKEQLSAKESISISIQMVTGIQAAHNHHIIHRDIKPQNIIISKDGKVKVTDFGIARATTSTNTISTNVMGSVHYTSPEHARGGIVDEKSDIYSAGITMYEMVTGHVPFDGDSTVSVAIKHLQEEIPSPVKEVPDIPYSLECIILKCTQKNAERRYQNCEELIQDLKRSLVDPDGDFVNNPDYVPEEGATILMSEEDQRRLQEETYQRGAYDSYDDYDDYDDGYDDYGDDGYDDRQDDYYDYNNNRNYDSGDGWEEERGNSSTRRIMRALLVVSALIIAFVLLFMVGSATGFFKSFSSPLQKEEEKAEQVEVPDVSGKPVEEAGEILNELGLGYHIKDRVTSEEFEDGEIIEQDPGAGTKVDKNTEIQLIVSNGKEIKKVRIPNVIGQEDDKAQKILEDSRLVAEIQYRNDESVEFGKVISTEPGADVEVDEGSRVIVYVSSGAEKVKVPSLTGHYQSDVDALLADAGLNGNMSGEEYSDKYEAGMVVSQDPKEGRSVDRGSTVNYVISKGPEPRMVDVPNLAGMREEEALASLSEHNLEGYVVEYRYDNTVTEGYVISQTASGQLEEGSQVGIVVSMGPEYVPVPDGPGNSMGPSTEGGQ